MVLFHEKGKVFELTEKRIQSCYIDDCRVRLLDKKGKIVIVPYYETSLGKICEVCFKKMVEGKEGSYGNQMS